MRALDLSALLRLVRDESGGRAPRILALAAVSGLANAAILAIVNRAAFAAGQPGGSARYFLLFAVAAVLYVVTLNATFQSTTRIIETSIERLRMRILEKIGRTDLASLEAIGTSTIYNALTRETATLTTANSLITTALQSGAMVLFGSLYVFFLSPLAFLVIAVLVLLGVTWFFRRERVARAVLRETTANEVAFFGNVHHALSGFKETRLHWQRQRDLLDDIAVVSAQLRDLRIRTNDLGNRNHIFGHCFFFGLLAGAVFVFPTFVHAPSSVVMGLTTSVLFLMAPLTRIIAFTPELNKANVAAETILELEARLDAAAEPGADAGPPARQAGFTKIELRGAVIRYKAAPGESAFQLGPIDFTLAPGELVFLAGGNGSGKSTLIRMLTGLQFPQQGAIVLDGLRVGDRDRQRYRELFSAVFADFHLFEKLYGLLGTEPARVNELLRLMQIDRKTHVTADRFSTLDLSTGQRKRLALVIALLDDRPAFVFDELAADQDPEFRRFLYESLLPELRARGKAVVAATHDDRWFHIADRVVRLDYGRVAEMP
ncbi:MAG TPA: cyclic peptide export ABC transporter [Thermoanaerobaculia bacterium]|jgi:putative ATP-binding cassette transporter